MVIQTAKIEIPTLSRKRFFVFFNLKYTTR